MDQLPKRLISIVVPVLNEELNIETLYTTVLSVFDPVADRYQLEFIFTDNHSTDQTFEILERLSQEDPRVKVLRFSRNFGYQRSILTGYLNAKGDAVIQLDCDLQDPPAMLLKFIEQWEAGNKVVYGVRKRRQEGAMISFARKVFYRLINALSEHSLPLDAGDFRLVDRRIIEELRRCRDTNPYLRGQIAAMGFQQVGLEYDRHARREGESKFSFSALVSLALDGIVSQSQIPLRLARYVCQATFALTCLSIAVYVV